MQADATRRTRSCWLRQAVDLGALRLLYDRHAPWLSARLTRRCNSADAVADVLQDTFMALWKGAERWRGTGEVAAGHEGIAARRLVSRLRRNRDALMLPLQDVAANWPAEISAEESVLLGVEYGDLGNALLRLSNARRGPGSRARRPDHPRSSPPAGHPGEHREDPPAPGQSPPATEPGGGDGMKITWHADDDLLARYVLATRAHCRVPPSNNT